MDGWLGGQIGRQTDKWVGRWASRQTGRQVGEQVDRWAGRQTGKQADGWVGGWSRQAGGQTAYRCKTHDVVCLVGVTVATKTCIPKNSV